MLEVPYTSPRPLWSMAQYNPTRSIGQVTTCPTRPWWWLVAAAAAGGAVAYWSSKAKPKGRRG